MPHTPASSYETQLKSVASAVVPVDRSFEERAWARLDTLTKPPRSLGELEALAARVAAVQRDLRPDVRNKAILLMAGDHGVTARGVSPYPSSVTAQMLRTFASGRAAINQIAESVHAQVRVVDVGVAADTDGLSGIEVRKVARGTADMSAGPAMSREECAEAVMVGVQCARDAAAQGITLLGTGEMGIGNTTPATALTAAFTGSAVDDVVGRGTGLDTAGVARKAQVVRESLQINRIAEQDALGVLSAVGGLEIAALAGVVLGAAEQRTCVVIDGFVATSAALAAVALCPAAGGYLIASHRSAEPGHALSLKELGLRPLLELDMRLGEGTGAALGMGLVDAACRVLAGMATFDEAGVSGASA